LRLLHLAHGVGVTGRTIFTLTARSWFSSVWIVTQAAGVDIAVGQLGGNHVSAQQCAIRVIGVEYFAAMAFWTTRCRN
jgi:hypothetical protein